jgi:uncharacterized protein (TIGR03067 family)
VRWFALSVLVMIAAPLTAAPAPFAKSERPDRRTDLEKMQGKWAVVSDNVPKHACAERCIGDRLVISGDQMTWLHPGIPQERVCLYPGGDPSAVDVICEKSGGLRKGIYKLHGDLLILSFAAVGEERPTSFTSLSWTVILRRDKS